MTLDELSQDEQTALGGLLRMTLRSDGDFTEAEEEAINAEGRALGGEAKIWRVISQSAQDCPNEPDVRAWLAKVQRAEARAFIRGLVERIAASDGTSDREHELLTWLRTTWS